MTSTQSRLQFTRRSLRLASGLTLFAYVATHLANHAAGLISLEAAESARLVFLAFWRSTPAAVLGGVPNQFIGDSVMAIFGVEADLSAAARQALAAARGIEARMRGVNAKLQREFGHTFGFGIGIHAGPAAVGEVGYRDTRTLSAVGDTVNTASRLQDLTKHYEVPLVISERVALAASIAVTHFDPHEISVRGRAAPLTVYAVRPIAETGA